MSTPRRGIVAAALLAVAAGATLTTLPAHAAPTDVVVNEVESNGGTPGDWFELVNKGTTPVDISGWSMLDSDDTHTPYQFPPGTVLAPGGRLVVEEAQFGFGLGGGDAVRIFDTARTQIAVYSWTAHASGSWQRCADGTGTTWVDASSTKGAANACTTSSTPATTPPPPTSTVAVPTPLPWPGSADVVAVDDPTQYTGDLSGLDFTPDNTALWAVNNGASLLYKLDPANGYRPFPGWETGKALTYADGTGRPDTEGVTVGPNGMLYVATERNNADNKVSRIVLLEVDPATARTTRQWDLTGLLPATGANLGAEAVEWVAQPTTATKPGLPGTFYVGIEGSGDVWGVVLHDDATATVQLTPRAWPGVMALDHVADAGQLWVFCDDTCNGVATVHDLSGRGLADVAYARPAGMPNLNNEGVAIGSCRPDSTRPVIWADDGDTGGTSLRTGSLACTFAVAVTPSPTPTPTPTPAAPTGTVAPGLARTGGVA